MLQIRLDNGFNRTFMELKLKIPVIKVTTQQSFNRTFMELKPLQR